MKKILLFLFTLLFGFISCNTTDKAADSDIELPMASASETNKKPDNKNKDNATVESTRRAILRATRVQAETYAPVPFNEANRLFNEAIITLNDPKRQQELLQAATKKAYQAFDQSYDLYVQSQHHRLDALIEELKSHNIDRYEPENYNSLVEAIKILKNNLNNHEAFSQNEQRINELYAQAQQLMDRVEKERKIIDALYATVEKQYAVAQKSKADSTVLSQVAALLAVADDAREEFNLAMSKEYLLMAQDKLNSLTSAQEQMQTQTLMVEVRNEIISASKQTLLDDEQTPINPTEWNATIALEDYKALNPHQRFTLLHQAISLWQEGVAHHLTSPKQANDLFLQAREAVHTYLRGTATQFYVVQLRPARRDSLWRISGFPEIYDNPFLWPHIWSANQKMIPNPDLIFPGQKLVIPPVIQ
jgi:nucleoid-associated protein YgaU